MSKRQVEREIQRGLRVATPAKAPPHPEATAFAARLRASLAEMGISGPDDLAAWVASLPSGKHHRC